MRKHKLYDIDDNLVLSYKTDHKFHGSQLIEVTGTVILKKFLVFNNMCLAQAWAIYIFSFGRDEIGTS